MCKDSRTRAGVGQAESRTEEGFPSKVSHHSSVAKWTPRVQLFSAWPLVLLEYIMGTLLCILVEGEMKNTVF